MNTQLKAHLKPWVLRPPLPRPCPSEVTQPTEENIPPQKQKKRAKKGHTQFTRRKKRLPHVQAALPIYRQLQQLRKMGAMIKKRGRWHRVHQAPPPVAFQLGPPAPNLTYTHRVKPCPDFEPDENLPDKYIDDVKPVPAMDVNSPVEDDDSIGFNSEKYSVHTKMELIEESEELFLQDSPLGVQDEEMEDLNEEDIKEPFHETKLVLKENSVHDELILPVSPSEAELDLEETPSEVRLILEETAPEPQLILPLTHPNGEMHLAVTHPEEESAATHPEEESAATHPEEESAATHPEEELVLPVTHSDGEMHLAVTHAGGELVLPVTHSDGEMHLAVTHPGGELVLPVTHSDGEMHLAVTHPEEELALPETKLVFQVTHPESKLVLQDALSQAQILLQDTSIDNQDSLPETRLFIEETSPEPRLVLQETSPETRLVFQETSPEPRLVLQETSPETRLVLQETSPEPRLVLQETSPEPRLVLQDTLSKTRLVLQDTLPETRLVLQDPLPETRLLLSQTSPKASLICKNTSSVTTLARKKTSSELKMPRKKTSSSQQCQQCQQCQKSQKSKVSRKAALSDPKPVITENLSKHRLTLQEKLAEGRLVLRETLSESVLTLSETFSEAEAQVPPLHYTMSHRGLAETVMLELKQRLPFPWITLPDEHGIHVVLISRLPEKAIQRRIFFSFSGKEELSVHRKPVPRFIACNILQNPERDAVALVCDKREAFVDRVLTIVDRFRSYEICIGADDVEFKHLWKSEELGDIDKNWFGELRYKETFRPNDCELLVPTMTNIRRRCAACIQRSSKLKVKFEKGDSDDDNFDMLNWKGDTTKLLKKVKRLQSDLKQARSQVVMLLKESEDMQANM